MPKKIVILLAVFAAFLAFWIAANIWLDNPASALNDYSRWIVPLVLMIASSAILALAILLVNKDWKWILVYSAAVILPGLFVVGFGSLTVIGGLAGMGALISGAAQKIRNESETRIRVNINAMIGSGTRFILAGAIVFLSVAYYASPAVQISKETRQLPPTIIEMIQGLTRRLVGDELAILPAKERAQAEKTVVREVLDQINDLAGPYLKFLPFILAIGLFLLLQSLNFIFAWLAGLIAAGVFWILIKVNFIKIEKVMIEGEKISL
ncbi:MAG: hypothetical protein AAB561_01330 [Patescibacteria group bacterium]